MTLFVFRRPANVSNVWRQSPQLSVRRQNATRRVSSPTIFELDSLRQQTEALEKSQTLHNDALEESEEEFSQSSEDDENRY